MAATDQEFIDVWKNSLGRAIQVAKILGLSRARAVYARRNRIEGWHGIQLPSGGFGHDQHSGGAGTPAYNYAPRLRIDGSEGKAEDNPGQRDSGLLVLTFLPGGRLTDPEICRVINGQAWLRGQRVGGQRKAA